ncbi:hypothetical protein GH733_019064 [Mirounga leonina]|nr:hypothetical protein GH733_019064 [Mirounga leonina]
MVTAAHIMVMVEVKTFITQAVEVISIQVVMIWLADKKEVFPLLWKRRYPPPCDSYNTSSHRAPRGASNQEMECYRVSVGKRAGVSDVCTHWQGISFMRIKSWEISFFAEKTPNGE